MDEELLKALKKALKARGYRHIKGVIWYSKGLAHTIGTDSLLGFMNRGRRAATLADIPITLLDDERGVGIWGRVGWPDTIKPLLEEVLRG